VRKFVGVRAHSCDEHVALGSCSPAAARFLDASVAAGLSIVVAGAVGAGKTTLLNCLLGAVPAQERIVTCEEVFELRVDRPDVVAMQCRQPNLEGEGAVTLRDLVRESLRMRPDRIVVGEVRGAEVVDLLGALNTGHDGGAGTLHANSLADVPARLEALGALAGLTPDAVARQAVSAIGKVIHIERVGGVRRVAGLGRLELDDRDRLRIREDS
jgi:pilus assembly protein CpaF